MDVCQGTNVKSQLQNIPEASLNNSLKLKAKNPAVHLEIKHRSKHMHNYYPVFTLSSV